MVDGILVVGGLVDVQHQRKRPGNRGRGEPMEKLRGVDLRIDLSVDGRGYQNQTKDRTLEGLRVPFLS